MNFVDELKWRGLLHNIMPGTAELLAKKGIKGYIGFDPTSDSLHIGNMVQIMILVHFQRAGNFPYALVGGATGMIGDPSGKSEERNLLSEEQLRHNAACIKQQLAQFIDFTDGKAKMVNNYDWFSKFDLLGFLRNVGKHLSINYMIAKDSVQNRLEKGISYTEFTYQLIQGYDFYHLWKADNVQLQMGGSDQWGNITTGTELIRRMGGGEAYAITVPLLTKADGSKFGKSESGNIWLDPKKTSPYKFYQFWLNVADDEAEKLIKIFSFENEDEVLDRIAAHQINPHERQLQHYIAEHVTTMVHGEDELNKAKQASALLFGNATAQALSEIDEKTFLDVFEGVPTYTINKSDLAAGIGIMTFLTESTSIFPSKGEAKRMLTSGGMQINKVKIEALEYIITVDNLINNKYILIQKGKKNYFLVSLV